MLEQSLIKADLHRSGPKRTYDCRICPRSSVNTLYCVSSCVEGMALTDIKFIAFLNLLIIYAQIDHMDLPDANQITTLICITSLETRLYEIETKTNKINK